MRRRWSGTYRAVPPAETLERIAPLLPASGITRVANVTGLDRVGVPVVMVHRPNARSLAVFQGKGLTLDAAKASGIMEAIERFHAEYPLLPIRPATTRRMRDSHCIIDPAALPGTAPSATEDAVIDWVEGRDLATGDPCPLPLVAVALDERAAPSGNPLGLRISSTGLAAGNVRVEATLHALCEVVERDATTLWRYRGAAVRARRRVDLDTVDDADCRSVLDMAGKAGLTAAVWDATTEIRVPVFLAQLLEAGDMDWTPLVKAEGTGCHPRRAVALLRALTEALQARLTLISGARDDVFRRFYRPPPAECVRAWRREILGRPGGLDFHAAEDVPGGNFEEDLSAVLGRVRAAGFRRAVAVDLTREDFGVPVVRVVVPGLQDGELVEGYAPDRRTVARLAAP
ncbi:MAG TPA: YcaO-like family protein [Alphaproteobacteria bacterium]|nr:YcaO-like family protein [Alphaproteobacteria bacterium]